MNANIAGTRTKNPGERHSIPVDWSDRLGSDTITSSAWSVASADIHILGHDFTESETVVLVGGGIAGQEYWLQNTVNTANGQELYAFVKLIVETDLVP